jgi:hypothetical protein
MKSQLRIALVVLSLITTSSAAVAYSVEPPLTNAISTPESNHRALPEAYLGPSFAICGFELPIVILVLLYLFILAALADNAKETEEMPKYRNCCHYVEWRQFIDQNGSAADQQASRDAP